MWAVEPVVYLVRCRVVTRSQWCAIADTVHVDMIVRARNIMHAKRKNCVGQNADFEIWSTTPWDLTNESDTIRQL